jgi:hypothetical protein
VVPGVSAPVRNHWLFPMIVQHVEEVQKELNDNGVDAYRGATQLALVPTPNEVKEQTPPPVSTQSVQFFKYDVSTSFLCPLHRTVRRGVGRRVCVLQLSAADMMARTLYLPMHRNVPVPDIVRMALVMHKVVQKMDNKYGAAQHLPSKL